MRNHFASFAIGTGMFMLCLLAWNAFVPVVALMEARPVSLVDRVYTARVSGYKIRGCDIVAGSSVGWQRVSGQWTKIPFAFLNDKGGTEVTRPSEWEKQNFGLWQWGLLNSVDDVRLTVQHNCKDGNDTFITVIGPFALPSRWDSN